MLNAKQVEPLNPGWARDLAVDGLLVGRMCQGQGPGGCKNQGLVLGTQEAQMKVVWMGEELMENGQCLGNVGWKCDLLVKLPVDPCTPH